MGRGPGEAMVETLLARREHWGITYITIPASGLAACEPVIARLQGDKPRRDIQSSSGPGP